MHKRHRAGLMLLLAMGWAGTSILAHSADVTVTRTYRVYLPSLRFQKPPPPTPTPTPRPTAQPTVVPTPDPLGQLNQQERDILTLLAAQRLAAGCLVPLAFSPALAQAARAHSADMAVHNYFSHTGSDGSSPAARAARAGYPYLAGWEVIAAGYSTPADAIHTWMNSGSHRAILLDCSLTDVGPGFVLDSGDTLRYTYYWTIDLGRR
jgi:uncharacterized protein YkwD